MANINPSYIDNTELFKGKISNIGVNTPGDYSMEHSKYVDIDLTGKCKAFIMIQVGSQTIYANQAEANLDNGLVVEVRPFVRDFTGKLVGHSNGYYYRCRSKFYKSSATILSATANSNEITLSTIPSPLFKIGDILYFEKNNVETVDSLFNYFEVGRVIKVDYSLSSPKIILDSPLLFNRSGETVKNGGDAFPPLELTGGFVWRIILNYGQPQSISSSCVVRVLAQIHQYDTHDGEVI